jgi:two-component system response regulator YesN
MYSLQAAGERPGEKEEAADTVTQVRDGLTQFFQMYPEYLLFRWNLTTYAVLIKGDDVQIDTLTTRCIEAVQAQVQPFEKEVSWYLAAGQKTGRLSGLSACFEEVSRIFSYRHLPGSSHILTKENAARWTQSEDKNSLKNLDMRKIDPAVLRGFLQNGQMEEVTGFVDEYVESLYDAAGSTLFCQYLMLNVRFTAVGFLEELGRTQEEAQELLPGLAQIGQKLTIEELKTYIANILEYVLQMREQETKSQSRRLVRQAVEYIDRNYSDENISLKEVAAYTYVSANYFSAVFSQEMNQTFVEYLTQKRMERAKELLRQSDKRSAEIAAEVGYKDPHYFSFVFRKTQGCTPRDYRTGGKKG